MQCNLQDSFKRAIQKLHATKYHRMWIIDDKKKPIGVCALYSISMMVINHRGNVLFYTGSRADRHIQVYLQKEGKLTVILRVSVYVA